MIYVTFPDGAARAFEPGVSGVDIAKAISPSLAKRTVAMVLDGELDATSPTRSTPTRSIEFIGRDDPRALELIRHDAAHVLAEAVQALFPGTQVTIGPVIENGFYYDFFRDEPFTPEDFAAIEKKMREIIARDKPIVQGTGRATRPRTCSRSTARRSRSNWSTPFPPTRKSRSTSRATGSTSAAARICPRPARSARRSS